MVEIDSLRDPLPAEEKRYLFCIRTRDEAGYLQLFRLYPNILWGSVTAALSPEENEWAQQTIQKNRRSEVDDGW